MQFSYLFYIFSSILTRLQYLPIFPSYICLSFYLLYILWDGVTERELQVCPAVMNISLGWRPGVLDSWLSCTDTDTETNRQAAVKNYRPIDS